MGHFCCWADSSGQQHFCVETSALLEPPEEEAAQACTLYGSGQQ